VHGVITLVLDALRFSRIVQVHPPLSAPPRSQTI
jgi:hypothetical protein